MARANTASATRQRNAFVRVVRVVEFLGGRPPRRPSAREARAFASLRFASTSAATPTTLIRILPRSETRATRTRASGFRASGEIEKRREIVSDLLVYHSQSSRDGKAVATECRDVEDAANARPASHSERLSQVAG